MLVLFFEKTGLACFLVFVLSLLLPLLGFGFQVEGFQDLLVGGELLDLTT